MPLALKATIMGYGGPMGSSAPPADSLKGQNEAGRLAEEQAALRRVATLVASGASSTDVFEAVAQEVAQVLRLPNTAIGRYDDRGTTITLLAVYGTHPDSFAPGSRWPARPRRRTSSRAARPPATAGAAATSGGCCRPT